MDPMVLLDEMNANPINWVLLLCIGYLLWVILAPLPAAVLPAPKPRPPINPPMRNFTLEELSRFNGLNEINEHHGRKSIYIACGGVVFDMTSGGDFYGPGGPYSVFAGRDSSRGLATMSLGPPKEGWDDLEDLDEEARSIMADWAEKFAEKYPIRGKLVRSHDEAHTVEPAAAGGEGLRKRAT